MTSKVRTHYDNLKVSREAPQSVIKAAYKVLAQEHHPDKHRGSAESMRIMKVINDAYETLSDPERRRKHDYWIDDELLAAERAAIRAATATPVPAGTRGAGAGNNQSGRRNKQQHHRPASAGWADKTMAWKESLSDSARLRSVLWGGLLVALTYGTLQLKERSWAAGAPQPAPARAAAETLPAPAVNNYSHNAFEEFADRRPPATAPSAVPSSTSALPAVSSAMAGSASAKCKAPADKPWACDPVTAPNQRSWPATAAELSGMPRAKAQGLSTLTVDNSSGDSDVYVKLCPVAEGRCEGYRHVFIPLGSSFTMKSITRGEYELRFQDVSTGVAARSQPISLEEQEAQNGTRYSNASMALLRPTGGNTRFSKLSSGDF